MIVEGVSVLECVGEITVWTRDRLADLVCGAQMELPVSSAIEELVAQIALDLQKKTPGKRQ